MKDYIVYTIHGFLVTDQGEGTTDQIVPYFEEKGFHVHEYDYGFWGFLKVRFRSNKEAKKLADHIKATGKKAIVVCHSQGNVIAHLAAKNHGANIAYHVAINPALDVKTEFDDDVMQIDVYYNKHDFVVKASRLLRMFSPLRLIKKSYWGEMGRKGSSLKYTHITNIDQENTKGLPIVKGHSNVFRYRNLRYWGDFIASRVKDWVNAS